MELEKYINWIVMGVGFVGVWYRNQFKIERLEERFNDLHDIKNEKHNEIDRQFEAIWKWKDEHSRNVIRDKEGVYKELSELRGMALVNTEQFKQVLNLLQEIKERITRLENGR